MEKKAVSAGAPVAGSPYSPGLIAGNLVFVSGQVPLIPGTKELVRDDIAAATKQCLENMKAILKAAGTDMSHVVKCVVFLTNMADFAEMNGVYGQYFGDVKPARSCIQVAGLPLDADVEIEAIAVLP